MSSIRFALAAFLLATGTLIGTSRVSATPVTTPLPQTDFTLVTPSSALLYLSLQSTSPRQASSYARIVKRLLGQQGLQTLLGTLTSAKAATATGGGNTAMAPQLSSLLSGTLGKIFNGELCLALLPSTARGGNRVHLLLDAGLQPGITGAQLQIATALLGLGGTSQQSYRGLVVLRIDVNALLRTAGATSANTATGTPTLLGPNGAIPSLVYATVAGNDAVLATDLPTLKAAIDTYSGVRRSLGATDAYAATVGVLPGERFALLYAHLSGDAIRPVIRAIAGSTATALIPGGTATLTLGASLTVQPKNRLFFAASTPQGVLGTVLPITL